MLLIYQVQPPTEHDQYIIKALTTAKKLCIEFKNRLNKIIREATVKQTERSTSSLKAVEEGQKESTEASDTESLRKVTTSKLSEDDQQVML